MNGLLKLGALSLIAVGAAACGHEARVTGPTQCFAPNAPRVVRASEIVRGRGDLAPRPAADPTPL